MMMMVKRLRNSKNDVVRMSCTAHRTAASARDNRQFFCSMLFNSEGERLSTCLRERLARILEVKAAKLTGESDGAPTFAALTNITSIGRAGTGSERAARVDVAGGVLVSSPSLSTSAALASGASEGRCSASNPAAGLGQLTD